MIRKKAKKKTNKILRKPKLKMGKGNSAYIFFYATDHYENVTRDTRKMIRKDGELWNKDGEGD